MKTRIIWLFVGLILIETIRFIVGVGNLANEIQVLGAVPWVYMIYRLEHLHRKHDHKGGPKP